MLHSVEWMDDAKGSLKSGEKFNLGQVSRFGLREVTDLVFFGLEGDTGGGKKGPL